MKWLEIIEVRVANSNRQLLQSQLKRVMNEVEKEIAKEGIKIFHQVVVDTDYSIHLSHRTDNVEKLGSQLGLSLVSLLKEFGLVHLSIWVEMRNDEHIDKGE